MTRDQLEDYLTNNLGKHTTLMLADSAVVSPNIIATLFDIIRKGGYPLNWRAAWVIDHINQLKLGILQPYATDIEELFFHPTCNGVERHMIKILVEFPELYHENGLIIDRCFQLLKNSSTSIATRAHAMELLYQTTLEYPDLWTEFKLILDEIIINGSKGEKGKAQNIIKLIKKRNPQI